VLDKLDRHATEIVVEIIEVAGKGIALELVLDRSGNERAQGTITDVVLDARLSSTLTDHFRTGTFRSYHGVNRGKGQRSPPVVSVEEEAAALDSALDQLAGIDDWTALAAQLRRLARERAMTQKDLGCRRQPGGTTKWSPACSTFPSLAAWRASTRDRMSPEPGKASAIDQ
jgi:hypothetical protein